MSTEPKPDTSDETAAIDLAVAFFCAVLVLFVFVAFNLDRDPKTEPFRTASQEEITIPAPVPAWTAINQRGSFALWSDDRMIILDLPEISKGMRVITDQYQGADGYMSYLRGSESSPASFRVDFGLTVLSPPEPWVKAVVTQEGACPETIRSFVTLFIPEGADRLNPIFDLSERCGFRVRFETLKIDSAGLSGTFALALSAGSFGGERIFR